MLMIDSPAHHRQGRALTNFRRTLPAPQSDLAQQVLKDPYTFDFLTLDAPCRERDIEQGLVRHVARFLLELGSGFAFVGEQYRFEVSDREFLIDLLLYHTRLHCYVVVELKAGEFKPEHAGQLNFYLSAVDDRLRHPSDQPTIGLILCQTQQPGAGGIRPERHGQADRRIELRTYPGTACVASVGAAEHRRDRGGAE